MQNNWIGLHIHYNSAPDTLLRDVVTPLVEELRRDGAIRRFFFIRYWEQGPHVRLRLLVAGEARRESVAARAARPIARFLATNPSLFQFPTALMPQRWVHTFIAEYGEAALHEKYGAEAQIPYATNNSIAQVPYVPEYARYGGPVGVELAERHFEVSSTLALRHLADDNGQELTIILGRACRMMLLSALVLLPDPALRAEFFRHYQTRWTAIVGAVSPHVFDGFQHKYRRARARVGRMIEQCLDGIERPEALSPQDRAWAEHLAELGHEVGAAYDQGALALPGTVDSALRAKAHLLGSYMHMTNNRLGLGLGDEIYLAYLLEQGMKEHAQR